MLHSVTLPSYSGSLILETVVIFWDQEGMKYTAWFKYFSSLRHIAWWNSPPTFPRIYHAIQVRFQKFNLKLRDGFSLYGWREFPMFLYCILQHSKEINSETFPNWLFADRFPIQIFVERQVSKLHMEQIHYLHSGLWTPSTIWDSEYISKIKIKTSTDDISKYLFQSD